MRVKPHPFFQRRGDDLLINLTVNIAQATLGAEIPVPTPEGEEATLRLPPGTQPGQVFRIPGKGAPRLRRQGRGDLLVVVEVEIPRRLTAEQRRLMEALAATMNHIPQPKGETLWDRLKEFLGG